MNGVSIQMNPDGSESSKSINQAMNEKPAAPESVHRTGGIVHRIQMDENGNGTFTSKPAASKPAPAAVPSSFGISPQGSRVRLDQITDPKAVLDLAGYGTSSAEVYENMGLVKRLPGGGYALVTPDAAPVAEKAGDAAKGPEAKGEPPATDDEVSLVGVEGTPATVDMVNGQIKRQAGDQVYNGLVTAYIHGSDPQGLVEEVARRTGQDPAQVREATDGVFRAFESSAKSIARANGVPEHAWSDLIAWASEKNPDAAIDAFHAIVNHEAGPLARLAKQYARTGRGETAYSDADLLGATYGDGVKAVRTEKGVQLEIRGHGRMDFKAAVARGLVRWSK